MNGPITRAAQEAGKSDKDGKSSNSIVDLDLDTRFVAQIAQSSSKIVYCLFLFLRNEAGSPVISILCGVIGAVVVVFLVIVITLKVRLSNKTLENF